MCERVKCINDAVYDRDHLAGMNSINGLYGIVELDSYILCTTTCMWDQDRASQLIKSTLP